MKNTLTFKSQTLFSMLAFMSGLIGIAAWLAVSWESAWRLVVLGIVGVIVLGLLLKLLLMPVSFVYSKNDIVVKYLFAKKTYPFAALSCWQIYQIKTINDTYQLLELYFGEKKVNMSKQEYQNFDSFLLFLNKNFAAKKKNEEA